MAHILVVDDDPDTRAALRHTLEFAGYTVSEAENGRHGLEVLERIGADVVLLDLQMPLVSGSAFIEALQKRVEARPCSIIAMSGYVDASCSPAEWFLPKPLDLNLLLAVVAHFSGKRDGSPLWPRRQRQIA